MSLKKSYDTVIFGSNLSGMLTAALLRDRGADVLLLGDKDLSHKAARGFHLDMQMLPLGYIPDSHIVTNTLGRLGIGLDNKEIFSPLSHLFQVVLNNHRVDIRGNREDVMETLRIEFPDDIELILSAKPGRDKIKEEIRIMARAGKNIFPSGNLRTRAASRKNNGSHDEDSGGLNLSLPMKKFVSLCLEFAIPVSETPDELSLMPFPLHPVKSYYPKGGMTGFKKLIMKRLEERGIDIFPTSSIQNLTIRKRRVTTIDPGNSLSSVITKSFVFNSAPSSLPPLLPKGIMTRPFRKRLEGHRPWGRWRSLFIGIDKNRIPVGMKETLLTEGEGNLPILIQMAPESENGAAPEGMRLLKASTPVSFGSDRGEADAKKGLEDFEKSVTRKLKELMPFLDDAFEVICRDDEPLSQDDYIFEGPLKGPLSLGTLSPLTPYKNLFMAGREVVATLGIEGDFISAEIIADYVSKVISETGR